MNAFLCYLSIAVFLSLAPLLYVLRFLRGGPGWWAIFASVILIGWASWAGATVFYFEAIADRIESGAHVPASHVETLGRDSGPKTFALLFGWVPATVYSALCTVLYALASVARRLTGRRRRRDRLDIHILNRTALLAPDERE